MIPDVEVDLEEGRILHFTGAPSDWDLGICWDFYQGDCTLKPGTSYYNETTGTRAYFLEDSNRELVIGSDLGEHGTLWVTENGYIWLQRSTIFWAPMGQYIKIWYTDQLTAEWLHFDVERNSWILEIQDAY